MGPWNFGVLYKGACLDFGFSWGNRRRIEIHFSSDETQKLSRIWTVFFYFRMWRKTDESHFSWRAPSIGFKPKPIQHQLVQTRTERLPLGCHFGSRWCFTITDWRYLLTITHIFFLLLEIEIFMDVFCYHEIKRTNATLNILWSGKCSFCQIQTKKRSNIVIHLVPFICDSFSTLSLLFSFFPPPNVSLSAGSPCWC